VGLWGGVSTAECLAATSSTIRGPRFKAVFSPQGAAGFKLIQIFQVGFPRVHCLGRTFPPIINF